MTVREFIKILERAASDYDDPVLLVRPMIGDEEQHFDVIDAVCVRGQEPYVAITISRI
jgi:hypothetical protein